MGKGKIIGAVSYAALEGAFIEGLAGAGNSRGGSVWALVPTNLLALHLRRVTARRMGGVAGVEFLTLKDAARRMALPSLALRGGRPLPAGAVELVLQRLLEGVADDSYFAAFRRFSNGAAAIGRAIRLLEDCTWTPEALRAAADAAGQRDPAAPRRLRQLADIWEGLRAWKERNALFEDDDLVSEAAGADLRPAEHPEDLFIYGFYDFNPSQRLLVGRLIRLAARCSAYLLWASPPAAGFEFALPTVQWLGNQLGADGVECVHEPPTGSDLERLIGDVFQEHPLLREDKARQRLQDAGGGFDGSVRVLSCPGELSEAAEVAREVLRVAGAAGAPQSIGVLLRGTEGAAGPLAEAFERTGVRCYVREGLPLAETVAGRVALSLLELAVGGAERTAVVDFLALADVAWPAGLSASALDRVARQAGIIKGRADWERRLRARAEQLRREGERTDDEAEQRICARDAALCTAGVGFLREFFEKIAPLSSPPSWRDVARVLHALVREHAPPDDPAAAPVLEVIDGLGSLDVTGTRPNAERVRWLLGRWLAQQSRKCERFQHVGAAVSSIMGARGAAFDVVIAPGLVEKGFPRHAPRSSLLTELDREALNGAAARLGCAELPLRKDRPLEERYLFRIVLGSARRALVLTYARLEQDSGRPKIPSRFLTDACSALAGCDVSASLLEEGLPAGLVQRVPLNRRAWAPEELKFALDALEYDGAVFTGPTGGAKRVAYMAAVSDTFRRAAQMDRRRWRRRDFGPYDGKVRAADLVVRLQEEYARFGSAISPTRFETYARCPFEYFLTYVLGIEEVDAPSEEFQLPAMERGSLVHDLLRRLYEERLKDRSLGQLTDEEVEAIAARGAQILDELGRVHAENHPATWTAERERTMDQLKALLIHERDLHAESVPAFFEYEFGISEPAAFVFELSRDAAVAFRGRIDRVDAMPDGAIRVVDYKTGSSGRYKKNRFAGGTQLQLPIYLLAATELMETSDGSALYLMVSGPKDVPQFGTDELRARMGEFRRALRLIVEGIAAGDFFPLPASTSDAQYGCEKYCRYRNVCGAARRNLAEMKQTDPDAARLAELRAIE